MKKGLLVLTALVLACSLVLIGCTAAPSAPAPTKAPGAAPAAATPQAAPAKVLKLRFQSNVIPQETTRDYTEFAKRVEMMTGGRIVVELFSMGQILPLTEQLTAIGDGALDMGSASEGYYSGKVPVTEIASGLPFSFTSMYEAEEFMYEKGFLEILREEYAKQNVRLIALSGSGVGLMTKKPINKASDLQGMKIRSFGAMADWLVKMGAKTVNIPGGELYTALATGVVDGGHWGSPGPMFEMKFQEVLKYIMQPDPIAVQQKGIHMNMKLWNSLSKEDQAIIETAALAGVSYHTVRKVKVLDTRALQNMVTKFGVTVVRPSDEEMAKMRAAAMEVWEDISKKNALNAKVIGMIKEYLKELGYLK